MGTVALAGMEYRSRVVQETEEEEDAVAEGSPWVLQDHPLLVAAGRSLGRV